MSLTQLYAHALSNLELRGWWLHNFKQWLNSRVVPVQHQNGIYLRERVVQKTVISDLICRINHIAQ